MSTLVIAALIGLGVGAGGVLGVQALGRDRSPEVVEATAGVVEEATRREVTEAETRREIAASPPATIAVQAAVEPGADPTIIALAAYLACIQAAQGKGEGSAAFTCQDRGRVLDALLTAARE